MATRDYKARRARALDAQRLRDFGAGAALGIALTAAAALWLGAGSHRAAVLQAADPQAQPPTAAAPAAPAPSFPEILAHPEAQVPRQEQVLAATAAKAHRR